jgi:hypothetical protein
MMYRNLLALVAFASLGACYDDTTYPTTNAGSYPSNRTAQWFPDHSLDHQYGYNRPYPHDAAAPPRGDVTIVERSDWQRTPTPYVGRAGSLEHYQRTH